MHELHRLYNIQRNLVDEGKGKNLNEDMDMSGDRTFDNASKTTLPLLPNSTYGEGSSAQVGNGPTQNGVNLVKVGRRMIDLQLPADQYLDTDEASDTGENTTCPPFKQSGGDASHRSNSSGSFLDVKNSNGLADLNEPFKWQDSEPVPLSRDTMYSHYGRNNADVQGQWLERNRSQNGWMVLEGGEFLFIQVAT